MTPWSDPSLQVASDTLHRARYRLLQSWWREHVLRVPPGFNGRQYVGSLLPRDADPDLNFLTDEVCEYAGHRIPQIQSEGGALHVERLRRNLLSSQPLCCNVFGHLQAHLPQAPRLLASTFGVPIDEVVRIEVEWAPLRTKHLGDRTAFGAFVDYRAGGRRQFLGIEVKYTEPFSVKDYDRPEYRALTADSGLFEPDAAQRLVGSATNQLWRQTLLVASLAATDQYDNGRAAILSLDGDAGVTTAVAGLNRELLDARARPAVGTLERLALEASEIPELAEWAATLRRRYLDLTPLQR